MSELREGIRDFKRSCVAMSRNLSKPEKWYQRRLAKYFTEHYEKYEDTAEYWNDPAPNQWLFDIPELGIKVELTCSDKGIVSEEKYPMRGLDL